MSETHRIYVDGELAATVTVKSPIELCTHVAAIRAVYEPAGYSDPESDSYMEPSTEITSTLTRLF